jgi:hypothetical protein
MIDRALIILPEWGKLILQGYKTWEVRSSNTKIRGKVGLAFSKTDKIFGEIEIVDSIELTEDLYNANFKKHRILCEYKDLPSNYRYAWVLANPVIYETPIEYKHLRGAIIWVKL